MLLDQSVQGSEGSFVFRPMRQKSIFWTTWKVDVSGRVLFPSSSKQKGTKDTWSLQVTCDNELLIKAGLMQYLYLWFMEHEKKFEWGGGGGGNKARSGAMLLQETLKWIQRREIDAKETLIGQR